MISNLRILHTEDDRSVQETVKAIFGVYNAIKCAPTLSAARTFLKDHTFDLVLLDKSLPDGEAIELLPAIRSEQPGAAVLLVTGDSDFLSVTRCLELGADDYIFKSPHLVQDLMLRIPVVLANRNRKQLALSSTAEIPLPDKTESLDAETYTRFLQHGEREFLRRALELCAGDTDATAVKLGIGRSTLFKKLSDLKVPRPRGSSRVQELN